MLYTLRCTTISTAPVYCNQSPHISSRFVRQVLPFRIFACSLSSQICPNSRRLLRNSVSTAQETWRPDGLLLPSVILHGISLVRRLEKVRLLGSADVGRLNVLPDGRGFSQREGRCMFGTGSRSRVWRVAFVGRANVGKSSLYNRFLTAAGDRKRTSSSRRSDLAIVGSRAGTTRDRRDALCSVGALRLRVSDTGGAQDQVEEGRELLFQIGKQVERAVEESDVVVFIVDAAAGVTPLDELVAKWLRGKVLVNSTAECYGTSPEDSLPRVDRNADTATGDERLPPSLILVLNKMEDPASASCIADVYDMQLGDPVMVSAKYNRGLDDLYDRLRQEVRSREKLLVSREDAGDESEFIGSSTDETETHYASEMQDREPPTPTPASISWLEGLARRYGGGLKATLTAVQNPQSSIHLPWNFDKTSLSEAAAEARAAFVEEQDIAPSASEISIENSTTGRDSKHTALVMCGGQGEDVLSFLQNASHAEKQIVLQQLQDMNIDLEQLGKLERSSEFTGANPMENTSAPKKSPSELIESEVDSDEMLCITFIGRPNAGKSTLVNSLLGYSRLVVSENPGTTTDSVGVEFEFKRRKILLTDTAGVTRGWRMRKDDFFHESCLQTHRNIRRAHVCVLCLDAAHVDETGAISSNDLALACRASKEEGRCLVVCVTKWDLIHPNKQEAVRSMIHERLQTGLGHLKGCPIVFTSAKNSQNLNTLLNKALMLYKRWGMRVPTPRVNAWLQEYTTRWPPPWHRGSQCHVKYITQVKAKPPTFVAWSNVYAHFPLHYQRQLVNAIREEFGMMGIPIRFVMRTTAMPKPGIKLTKAEALKWKRLGPLQHRAAANLGRKYKVKKFQRQLPREVKGLQEEALSA